MACHRTSRSLGLLAVLLVAVVTQCREAVAAAEAASSSWDAFQQEISSIIYGSSNLGQALVPVMAHAYRTPIARIQSADVYSGSSARLRRVVNTLLSGGAITVAAIGGVATNGSAASQPGANDYVAQYVAYLRSAFPRATVNALRKSAGVAPSAVVAQCQDKFLAADADLVLLEMVASDGRAIDTSVANPVAPQAYELLLRRVLGTAKQPAVILTQTLAPGMGNGSCPFYMTPEAPHYASLATYYNTGYASLRNALWDPASTNEKSATTSVAAVKPADGTTLLDAGHNALADMLIYKTQKAVQDVALMPYGDYDMQSMRDDVPHAMYPDVRTKSENDILLAATCTFVNSTLSADCPSSMDGLCDLDYSSYEALSTSYDNAELGGSSSSSSSLSTAALIGIIVGAIVGGLLLLGLGVWLCTRARRRSREPEVPDKAIPIIADEPQPVTKVQRPTTVIVASSATTPPVLPDTLAPVAGPPLA